MFVATAFPLFMMIGFAMQRRLIRALVLSIVAAGCSVGQVAVATQDAPRFSDDLRVSPPIVPVAGEAEGFTLDLNGQWAFMKDVPPDFDAGFADDFDWDTMTVPGHFATQGFGRMHKEFGVPVALRKQVEVPASWAGRRVLLRFDSVEGYTTLWVNGEEVAQRDTHYLPLELDVTDFVTPGESADVVLTVSKSSITQWWRPEKGGIRRDVSLFAVPQVHVSAFNVATDFDDAYDNASMQVQVEATNASASESATTVTLELHDANGEPVDLGDHAVHTLPAIPAGASRRVRLDVPVDSPRHWNTETPHLYTLRATLETDAGEPMSVQRRFGFREIEVDGHLVRINGQVIKIKGVNFHQTWPGTDYFTPVEQLRKDLELFKNANLNYLRIWPVPDADVVALADEMGLLMQAEVPISMFIYRGNDANNHGNDPAYEPILHDWAEVMVEQLASHPSVMIWSLGNESWYWDFFKTTAYRFKELDPTRPVIFSGDQESGVGVEGVDINDDHYPRDGRVDFSVPGSIMDAAREGAKLSWDYPTDRPNMFSEWLHLPLGNIAEQRTDPGIWDAFAKHAKAHVDYQLHHDHILGGALFTGTPVTAIHERVIIGMYDPQRRINDAYWHVYKAFSPVRVELDPAGLPENPGFSPATFTVHHRGDFANLSEYRFEYRQGPNQGTIELEAEPFETVTMNIPFEGERFADLKLDVIGPDGRLVDQYRFVHTNGGVRDEALTQPQGNGGELSVEESNDAWRIAGDGFAWIIDRSNGQITHASVGEDTVPMVGPSVSLTNSAHWQFQRAGKGVAGQQQLEGYVADEVSLQRRGSAVVVTVQGNYTRAEGRHRLVFDAQGGLTVRFNYTWTGGPPDDPKATEPFDVFDYGVRIGVPAEFDRLTWRRDAFWTKYPDDHIGRPAGTTLAKGDPRWLQAREAYAAKAEAQLAEPLRHPDDVDAKPWPWSQDYTLDTPGTLGGVTRDFRSTKAQVRFAALSHPDHAGLAVTGAGDVHVRVSPSSDGQTYFLHAHPFWNGGTELHLAKSTRLDTFVAEPGAEVKGSVRFSLVRMMPGAEAEPAGTESAEPVAGVNP